MIREGVTLSLRGDAFKRVFRASIGVFFGQHIMRMIVYDWEGLYDLHKVFFGGIVEVCDVMEGRVGLWGWSHLDELLTLKTLAGASLYRGMGGGRCR